MPRTIILDTDFIIKITNDPLPRFDYHKLALEFTLSTTPSVVSELEGLSREKNSSAGRRARNALRLLQEPSGSQGRITILKTDSRSKNKREADEDLLELARKNPEEYLIATMDHSLLSRLEVEGLRYLTLRNDGPLFSRSAGDRV